MVAARERNDVFLLESFGLSCRVLDDGDECTIRCGVQVDVVAAAATDTNVSFLNFELLEVCVRFSGLRQHDGDEFAVRCGVQVDVVAAAA